MGDWIISFTLATATFNSILGVALYWAPLTLCAIGYTVRTARNYQKDLERRTAAAQKECGFYSPTDTVGTLIGRAFVSVLPIANLWACLFDIAPEMFSKFFTWLGKVFDQPLVPKR